MNNSHSQLLFKIAPFKYTFFTTCHRNNVCQVQFAVNAALAYAGSYFTYAIPAASGII